MLKRQFIWGEFLLKDNEGFQYIKLIMQSKMKMRNGEYYIYYQKYISYNHDYRVTQIPGYLV